MKIRSINSLNSQNVTKNLSTQEASANYGGVFVGGKGYVSVANNTDSFICAGGNSSLFLVNRGDDSTIQLGSGTKGNIKEYNDDGTIKSSFANKVVSVGKGCSIFGSSSADEVMSIGQDCDIRLGAGADTLYVDGVGTKVDLGDGDDTEAGIPAGLSYLGLIGLDVVEMLAEIKAQIKRNIESAIA